MADEPSTWLRHSKRPMGSPGTGHPRKVITGRKHKQPAINANLLEKVKSLLAEKLTKEKRSEVQGKYLRTENCTNLVAPKINKQIWQQLHQETRKTDSGFQEAQSLLTSGLYAVLQVCDSSSGNNKNALTYAPILLLSANRDINLKRRDLIRPDLNKQYVWLLCSLIGHFVIWCSLPHVHNDLVILKIK